MSGAEPRVASLLPSATEMVCAVGMEPSLVGVSHECDWPPSVVGRRVLTSSKIALSPRSLDIDLSIRSVLRDALAVYDIDENALAEAAPDVIVTQDLCDVCAVSFADVERAARALTNPDLTIVNLHPTKLADIWDDIRKVGEALGRREQAEAVLADMDRRVEAVRRRAEEGIGDRVRPQVLTIEWLDPLMVGGTWMPELVELAGGRALLTEPGQHAPTVTVEELAALEPGPDVIVVKPCGFRLERTLAERDVLESALGRIDAPAVRNGAVWLADGNAYFNRPGPRIVDSLEIMAACVHGEIFADLAEQHAGAFRRLSDA